MPRKTPKADSPAPENLPDNIADCHALIKELFARVAELEKQLSRRNRATFGQKSAKVDATLLTGTGKAIHMQTTSELEAEKQRLNVVEEVKHGGGRKTSAVGMETRKEEHRLVDDELLCPCCGEPRQVVGFEVSHQIEFMRSLF